MKSSLKDIQTRFLRDVINKNLQALSLTYPERLTAYASGYEKRLVDSVAFKFDILVWFAGMETLMPLIKSYVQAHPPQEFNINYYGLSFADWIDEVQNPVWHDIATMQRALHTSRFEGHHPPINIESLGDPQTVNWAQATFAFQTYLTTVETQHPVHKVFNAFHKEQAPPTLQRDPKIYGIYREQNRMVFEGLETLEHAILTHLLNGQTLGKALSQVQDPKLQEELFGYFHKWQTYGWITGITILP